MEVPQDFEEWPVETMISGISQTIISTNPVSSFEDMVTAISEQT